MSYPEDDEAYAHRPALEDWFGSELGTMLLQRETELLSQRLGPLFGYYLLQLSALVETDLSGASKIRHRFQFSSSPQRPGRSGAVSQFEALPLESDSVDVVVLHHVLEFTRHPHRILREAHRVLMPHGHLLLVCINPWSLFGLRTRALASYRGSPWRGHMITSSRMMDWLSLLDMRVTDIKQGFHHLPIQAPRVLHKFDRAWAHAERYSLPFGGVYLIEARKHMIALTPQKPRWRVWRPEMVPLGAASSRLPSSKNLH